MGPVHKMADKFQSPDSQPSREEKQRREALTDGGAKSATDGVTHNNKEKAPTQMKKEFDSEALEAELRNDRNDLSSRGIALMEYPIDGEGLQKVSKEQIRTFKEEKKNAVEWMHQTKRTLQSIKTSNKSNVNLAPYLHQDKGAEHAVSAALSRFKVFWNKDDHSGLTDEDTIW